MFLLKIWAYMKGNAILLGVVAAIILALTTTSYLKGRDHGARKCNADYQKNYIKQQGEVIDLLNDINTRDAEQWEQWAIDNDIIIGKLDNAKDGVVERIETIKDRIIEKPIYIDNTGPCPNIDYAANELLDDAASAASNN